MFSSLCFLFRLVFFDSKWPARLGEEIRIEVWLLILDWWALRRWRWAVVTVMKGGVCLGCPLRERRSAECPTPQRVRSQSPRRNIPGRFGLRGRCGLGQVALRLRVQPYFGRCDATATIRCGRRERARRG